MAAINKQTILPGEKIPSLDDLSDQFGVSRMTARQAVQELVRENKLYTVIGKGTFVTQKPKIEPPMNTIWGFTDSFSSSAGSNLSRLLSMEIKKSGYEIAQKLRIEPESRIYVLSRVRLIQQKPVAVEYSHLPYDRFPNLEKFDWNNVSLYNTLREKYKIKISSGKQFVEADTAETEIADLLNIRKKSPILKMDCIIMSDEGWHIEYAHTYYRADRIMQLSIQIFDNEPITLVKAESFQ
jgi:GntR family transcriptional regulator